MVNVLDGVFLLEQKFHHLVDKFIPLEYNADVAR